MTDAAVPAPRRDPLLILGGAIVALAVVLALVGPEIAPYDPT